MAFSHDYIRTKTAEYTQEALKEGRLVSPDEDRTNDGIHPETGRDLETPTSFVADMMDVWTLDQGLSFEQKQEIEVIVANTVYSTLPDDLKNYL